LKKKSNEIFIIKLKNIKNQLIMTTVAKHLAIHPEKRDLDWIKTALQAAIELEHSTLPLYLSGMFSLETQNYTTYNLIRGVVMEEMVHMAIACNLLSIMGGTPEIKNLNPGFPGYGLPGGAEPDIHAVLAKLSKKQLKNYLRVEMPDFLLPDEYKSETYPTIGRLYHAIKKALEQNNEAVTAAMKAGGSSNQVGDDIGFTTFAYNEGKDSLNQLYAGVEEILEQGEGNSLHNLHAGPGSEGEPSHYARFAEIYFGHEFQVPKPDVTMTKDNVADFFRGYVVEFPEVVNVLMVPSDGYEAILNLDPNAATVRKNIVAFDQVYTDIMNDLEAMWNGPQDEEWPTFGQAVGSMTELRVLSCFNIMRSQIPADIVKKLPELYPKEYPTLAEYTDLDQAVFYGPRFYNLNVQGK
jgi:hypothetical protein